MPSRNTYSGIGFRLIVFLTVLCALMGATGGYTLWRFQSVIAPLQHEMPDVLEEVNRTQRLGEIAWKIRFYEEVLSHSVHKFVSTGEVRWKQRFYAYRPEIGQSLQEALILSSEPEQATFEIIFSDFVTLLDELGAAIELAENGDVAAAEGLLRSASHSDAKHRLDNSLTKYFLNFAGDSQAALVSVRVASSRADRILRSTITTVTIAFVLSLILVVVAAAMIGRGIVSPIRQLTVFADRLSAGDFGARIGAGFHHSRDEIGALAQTFELMAANIAETQAKLRESEALLRSFVENSPLPISIKDPQGRYSLTSPATVRMFGLSTDATGKTADDLLSPDLASAIDEADQALFRPGTPNCEFMYEFGDYTMQVTKFPIQDDDGNITGIGTIATDVTAREAALEQVRLLNAELEHRVEERTAELRESEERLRLAIESAAFGSWIRTVPDDRVFLDVHTEAILGLAPGTFEGTLQDYLSRVHPDDRDRIRIGHQELVDQDKPYECDYRIIWPDGTVRYVTSRASVVQNDKGSSRRIIGMLHDITDRKRSEEALQAAQDELLRKERLAALGELTGTVAHELRNPLGAVAASAYVLQRKCGGQDPDVEKALGLVNRGIKRCDNIITELLDFARAKGLQPVPTNLDDWLSTLLAEQQLPAGVTLRRDLESDDAVACFDPEEMRRAVINVVDNACQAVASGQAGDGSEGSGEVTVETRATAQRVEIEITDSGPGIPEDLLGKVLEPLYSTKPFGTGLGLPTVHRIMEEHGGGLEIDSKEGEGTRVTLWLQRDRDTAEPLKA